MPIPRSLNSQIFDALSELRGGFRVSKKPALEIFHDLSTEPGNLKILSAHGGLIPALFAVLSNGSLVEQNLAVQTLANLRVEKANAAIINTQFFMMLPQLIILLNAGSLPTRTIIARALGSLSAQVVNLQAMIAFPPLFPALVGVLRLDQFDI